MRSDPDEDQSNAPLDQREPEGEVTLELLNGARQGSRVDLEALCERLAPAVLTWAHIRMRPAMRARVQPEEIVQEVWLRVLSRLDELEPGLKNFRAWVLGVARNVLFEFSRAAHAEERARGAELAAEDRWESFFERQQDHVTGVSGCVARRDLLQAFLARVDRFGEVERQLLVLRGLEGRSFDDIAQELELSRDVVAKRWQRLRARLQEEGVPEYLL